MAEADQSPPRRSNRPAMAGRGARIHVDSAFRGGYCGRITRSAVMRASVRRRADGCTGGVSRTTTVPHPQDLRQPSRIAKPGIESVPRGWVGLEAMRTGAARNEAHVERGSA